MSAINRPSDKYIGELFDFKVYRHSTGGYYYALDVDREFIVSGDTSEEVFDELASLVCELKEGK